MRLTKVIKRFIKNPYKYIKAQGFKKRLKFIPDYWYLKWVYKGAMDESLDLKNPQNYNEKIQWLKLYDRNPLYTKLADKYSAKEYVKELIGSKYIIPTIGIYDDFNEIDFRSLPNQFVLKCTHDSGSIIVCKDKKNFDIEDAKMKLNSALKVNHFHKAREWAYKDIYPRIICEKYMIDNVVGELRDYKIFCFSGEPKLIQVDFDRFNNHKRNLYTTEWKRLNLRIKEENDTLVNLEKPNCLEEVLELSKKLSRSIPHVRIDFYIIDNKIYFGEFTFYHGSGYEKIYPKIFGYEMGNWIKLPQKKLKYHKWGI